MLTFVNTYFMRIWSLHPGYLDTKGLLALWRETLLAKHVLEGRTKGYLRHPQLIRFRASEKPLDSINFYLDKVWETATARGYNFDRSKVGPFEVPPKMPVTSGQVAFELHHLTKKLEKRAPDLLHKLPAEASPRLHPLFEKIAGEIEFWEKI